MNMFVIGLFLEVHTGLFYQFAQYSRLYFQFHLLILHFAEFQQLVHHPQHTLAVALYDLQLTTYILTDMLILQNILYRRHDECQRRA